MKINNELRDLIPKLSKEEKSLLTESILKDGCRDALITWQGVIIDGHNRYEICTTNNIPFESKEMDFNNIDDVKLWMIDNQKGRRNLTDGWKFELSQVKKAILLERGKAKMSEGGKAERLVSNEGMSTMDKAPEHNTRKVIANDLGWSESRVARADKVWAKAKPEIKEQIKAGEVTFNQVYQEIKKEEKAEEKAQRFKEMKVAPLPKGTYRVLYVDPPWRYNDKQDTHKLGGAEKHYPTMSITELCEMELPKMEDNSVLFMWTTSPLLEDSFKIINSWGFKYKTSFVWDKVKHNMGHYNSVRHEMLLICTKGSCTPDFIKLFDSVQSIERSDKHSQKPEEFRDIIDTLYTYGNKIELFARDINKEGWDTWGNQAQ